MLKVGENSHEKNYWMVFDDGSIVTHYHYPLVIHLVIMQWSRLYVPWFTIMVYRGSVLSMGLASIDFIIGRCRTVPTPPLEPDWSCAPVGSAGLSSDMEPNWSKGRLSGQVTIHSLGCPGRRMKVRCAKRKRLR